MKIKDFQSSSLRSDKMKIYLDNGATTKPDPEVVRAMLPYFNNDYGNASSMHFFGEEAKKALENSRAIIAKAINASPEEIIFTSGGTESNNFAIKGICDYQEKGNEIITSKIEHPSVLNCCKALEKKGFKVIYIGVNEEGFINIDELKKAITEKTILVTMMHTNNEIGVIQPVEEVGKICKEKNISFHTDAVQSFTKIPIDVKKQNIDLASFSAHKIHGPKGIGALYVKKGTKIKKLFYGGHQEFEKRPGTENVAGIVGFAKAVELMKKEDIQRMAKLRDYLISEILKIPNTRLNGPRNRLCNNVNVSFKFIEGEAILLYLSRAGIAVSTGSACSSKSLKPSHVLAAVGLSPEISHGSIRITLSKYTTKEELNIFLKNLRETVNKLRRISPFS